MEVLRWQGKFVCRLDGFLMVFIVVDLLGWLAEEETQNEFGVAGECMGIGLG